MSDKRVSLAKLQPLGRALMLPIAVLPIAALLLRLGQPDMLDLAFVAAAGDAIFSNLGLLFAAGVAVGLARENHGAAALAGVVAYLVTTEGAKTLLTLPPDITEAAAQAAWRAKEIGKLSVAAGIAAGILGGIFYNRFSDVKLPDYLAFFGGRRFVPIAAGFAGILGALLFGLGFPALEAAVDALSRWVIGAGPIGLFLYGLFNRLLLITGLHHILNNLAWFLVGDFKGTTGDLKRFFAGDPSAGGFMAGFFPVMMFGLPAACLAMYRAAAPERRKAVGGLFLSLGLTSLLTGVTEPIEFTFIFLAPLLFAVHAVLTGLSMVIMDLLGVKLGFGFSAGLFDYVLNYGLSTRPLLLIPVGAVYFLLYYAVFSWCIRRFDLKTPGREIRDGGLVAPPAATGSRAADMIEALGGAANLLQVDACMTRLRLMLADPLAVDEAKLAQLGARGVVRPGGKAVQVVLGPIADQVAGEIRALSRNSVERGSGAIDARTIVDAIGGSFDAVALRSSRLILTIPAGAAVDEAQLASAGVRASARPKPDTLHLILGPGAKLLAAELERVKGIEPSS